MPHVSVVIPLYNKEAYIGRTLDSVGAQSFANFEVIVVNDGSTDGGAAIVRQYPDKRVRVVDCQRKGASAARNVGIAEAQSALIAFLDADDTWHPDFLRTVLKLYDTYPQAGMFGTAYETDGNGCRKCVRLKGVPKREWMGLLPDYFHSVLGPIPIISSAVMVPRQVFERVGPFAEGSHLGEDQDMWCRIALAYPVAYCTRCCAVYYLNTLNSVCDDMSIIQPYPVITTLENAIAGGAWNKGALQAYLDKLYVDYAVRFIRLRRIDEAHNIMRRARLTLTWQRLHAEYYLAKFQLRKSMGLDKDDAAIITNHIVKK